MEGTLITPEGTRGIVTRGKESTAGIPNEAIGAFENHHVIRAETRAGVTLYELTHDSLVSPIQKSNEPWRRKWRREAVIRRAWPYAAAALLCFIAVVVFGSIRINDYRLRLETDAAIQHALLVEEKAKAEILKHENEDRERKLQQQIAKESATSGRIEWLRKLPDWERGLYVEKVVDGVASYLWAEQDWGNLVAIIKKAEDLISKNDYGKGAIMDWVPIADKTQWPLVVQYNPKRKLDEVQLKYHWMSFAREDGGRVGASPFLCV